MVMKGWQKMIKYFKYYGATTLLFFAFIIMGQFFKTYKDFFIAGAVSFGGSAILFMLFIQLQKMGYLLAHLQR